MYACRGSFQRDVRKTHAIHLLHHLQGLNKPYVTKRVRASPLSVGILDSRRRGVLGTWHGDGTATNARINEGSSSTKFAQRGKRCRDLCCNSTCAAVCRLEAVKNGKISPGTHMHITKSGARRNVHRENDKRLVHAFTRYPLNFPLPVHRADNGAALA